ncbi:MAG: hypothetical protein ACPGQL_08140 [Thermoplasmatota archaeon]
MQFRLERYLDASRRLDTTGINWDAAGEVPLQRGERAFLQYATEVEDHTIVYLRELLATTAVEDPDVTAFLSCWVYEEHFHGRALERFLQAVDGDETPHRDLPGRLRREGRLRRAAKAVVMPVLSRALPDFPAVHMTWGAVNELTTLTGYQRCIERTDNPVLAELLARIIRDERRHYAFYYQQAKRRLARSPTMQRWTRRLMDRAWSPVGTGVYDLATIRIASDHLFDNPDGRRALAAAQDQIAKLPGMEGWTGLTDKVLGGARPAPAASRRLEPVHLGGEPVR